LNAESDGSTFIEAIKNRWGREFGFYVKIFFDDMTVKAFDSKTVLGEEEDIE
jgi:hypothetical protein